MSEEAPAPKPLTLAVRPNKAIVVPILHEAPEFIIVNKPAGMVTQPGKGHDNDSLLNGLFAIHDGLMGKMLHNLGARRDFGLLHRLDKDTSGPLVIAKTPGAYDQLRRDFEERHIDKEYLAITAGIPSPKQGVVQARLKEVQIPNPDRYASVKKVVISRQGQEAITAYRVVSSVDALPGKSKAAKHPSSAALVHLEIKTGRLHQIRAHMMFLNCHVLGDPLYPPMPESGLRPQDYPNPPRLCLHAARLGFKHPTTGKWVHFSAPFPQELAAYASKCGLHVPA